MNNLELLLLFFIKLDLDRDLLIGETSKEDVDLAIDNLLNKEYIDLEGTRKLFLTPMGMVVYRREVRLMKPERYTDHIEE